MAANHIIGLVLGSLCCLSVVGGLLMFFVSEFDASAIDSREFWVLLGCFDIAIWSREIGFVCFVGGREGRAAAGGGRACMFR